MTSTKKAFGTFVSAKRQLAGLTQRDLADRLFVTESAVSKWERGISYPDIALVVPLARELGVTESELVNASDDLASRRVEREARVYRRWRASIRWITLLGYGVALVTCFIVDLAAQHTLDWFWVVLTAIAVAFSLTTLPLLPVENLGWKVPAAFLVSLFALFTVVRVLYGSGSWLPIAVVAVLLAAVIVLGPVFLVVASVPPPMGHHRMLIAITADTVMLGLLLLVIFAARHDLHHLATEALPIAGLAALFAWVSALVIRYLPIGGLFRAAIVVAFVSAYDYLVFTPVIARISGEHQHNPVDLTNWDSIHVNGDVSLVSLLAGLLAALILVTIGAIRAA